jgi:hypothetical protein
MFLRRMMFWLGALLEVKFPEINYTFRHSDERFLRGVNANEVLGLFLKRGLVEVTACIRP